MRRDSQSTKKEWLPYAGRWVAQIRGRIVGQGGTPNQAHQSAKGNRYKETPQVFFVPTSNPLFFSPIFEHIQDALPPGEDIYLVGGAVRDALLTKPAHDYDFILAGDSLRVARKVANQIGAAYFPLDEDRKTARLIYTTDTGVRHILDFAAFRGPDLESDLQARDFTVNAMAVEVADPQKLYDPLGGATDLLKKTLRSCAPTAFIDDPVRIIRGIRLAAKLGLRIAPETRALMRAAVTQLPAVTPERIRDELWRILDGPKPHASIRALDMLEALPYILPELDAQKKVAQSPPHIHDVWTHTLETLKNLENILSVLGPQHDQDAASSLILGLAVMSLGRFRNQMTAHVTQEIVLDRPWRSLLFFAALYHDVAKPSVETLVVNGRTNFIDHDKFGADIAALRCEELRLSKKETDSIKRIVGSHIAPTLLVRQGRPPNPLEIYRFFRDLGSTGIDICLLSLADLLATYGTTIQHERWTRQLDLVRALLEAWWEQPEVFVGPPSLVTGHDLINILGLEPGPEIGALLENVREAQVMGEVTSKDDAITLIRKNLNSMDS